MLLWKNAILTGLSIPNFLRPGYRVLTVLRIFLTAAFLYYNTVAAAQPMHSSSTVYVFRLKPHEDLRQSIFRFAREHGIRAGIVLTCVGSLEQVNLRFANQNNGSKKNGHFEIVSLTGTFSDTSGHLHISVSDSTGYTFGGHLLDDNLVYTTAEIAIADLEDLQFDRVTDPAYGYPELFIRPRNEPRKP
jgi:uncharacterized protein